MTRREILKSDKLPARPRRTRSRRVGQPAVHLRAVPPTPQDIAGQTRQVMEKLKAIMAEAGTGFEHALKYLLLTDISEFRAVQQCIARMSARKPCLDRSGGAGRPGL
jgi:enamine deaminase RidA (YjgF/YER057c/UK114 family)